MGISIGAGSFNGNLHVSYLENDRAENRIFYSIGGFYSLEVQENLHLSLDVGFIRKRQEVTIVYTDNDGISGQYDAIHSLNYLAFSIGIEKSFSVFKKGYFTIAPGLSLQPLLIEKMELPQLNEEWKLEKQRESQTFSSGFVFLGYSFVLNSTVILTPFVRADIFIKEMTNNQLNWAGQVGFKIGFNFD